MTTPDKRSPDERPGGANLDGIVDYTAEELAAELEGEEEGEKEQRNPARQPARRLGSLMADAVKRLERRAEKIEKPIPLPWPSMAAQFGGGLWPGLHVLVGGTGAGKTQLGLQIGLHAADVARVPVLYVGLELDGLQLAARAAGLRAESSWSKLYLGKYPPAWRQSVWSRASGPGDELFFLEEGPPQGWPFQWLQDAALEIRNMYPEDRDEDNAPIPGSRPFLVILDFLQLVGDDPRLRGETRPLDIRERIGRAAYMGRQLARDLNAAVILISSTSRSNYAALHGDALEAIGLDLERETDDRGVPLADQDGKPLHRSVIKRPDILVGAGKEAGEIEFAADTVTAAIRWPEQPPGFQGKPLLMATAKVRAGPPGWAVLDFVAGSRLEDASREDFLVSVESNAKATEGKKKKSKTHGAEVAQTIMKSDAAKGSAMAMGLIGSDHDD